jgi:hypothetical protein
MAPWVIGAKTKLSQCYWYFPRNSTSIKFLDVVEPTLNVKLPIPAQIESVIDKEKK